MATWWLALDQSVKAGRHMLKSNIEKLYLKAFRVWETSSVCCLMLWAGVKWNLSMKFGVFIGLRTAMTSHKRESLTFGTYYVYAGGI